MAGFGGTPDGIAVAGFGGTGTGVLAKTGSDGGGAPLGAALRVEGPAVFTPSSTGAIAAGASSGAAAVASVKNEPTAMVIATLQGGANGVAVAGAAVSGGTVTVTLTAPAPAAVTFAFVVLERF